MLPTPSEQEDASERSSQCQPGGGELQAAAAPPALEACRDPGYQRRFVERLLCRGQQLPERLPAFGTLRIVQGVLFLTAHSMFSDSERRSATNPHRAWLSTVLMGESMIRAISAKSRSP